MGDSIDKTKIMRIMRCLGENKFMAQFSSINFI